MKFQKGHKKVGGKVIGSKNERTKQWDILGEAIVTTHTERFNKILDESDDETFKDLFLQSLEYFKPKLARTENKSEITINKPIILNWSDEPTTGNPSDTKAEGS